LTEQKLEERGNNIVNGVQEEQGRFHLYSSLLAGVLNLLKNSKLTESVHAKIVTILRDAIMEQNDIENRHFPPSLETTSKCIVWALLSLSQNDFSYALQPTLDLFDFMENASPGVLKECLSRVKNISGELPMIRNFIRESSSPEDIQKVDDFFRDFPKDVISKLEPVKQTIPE
jgi:hypothetical protein